MNASLVLYEEASGKHHWGWTFDVVELRTPKVREKANRLMELAVTKAEERLGLPATYPEDHWTRRAKVPDWLWGWPWDRAVSDSEAEE